MVVLPVSLVLAGPLFGQSPDAPHRIALRAARLIDGKSDTPITNAVVFIEGDKIASIASGGRGRDSASHGSD